MGTWVVVHVRMCEFVWKPEAKIGVFPSHYLLLFTEAVFQQTQSLLNLPSLASQLTLQSLCLCLPRAKITG